MAANQMPGGAGMPGGGGSMGGMAVGGMAVNTDVIKEPRGFMKVLQFIFSICAFATVSGFDTHVGFTVSCTDPVPGTDYRQQIEYPFKMDEERLQVCGGLSLKFIGDSTSDARFFVATGVLSFLYCIAATVLYVLFDKMYQTNHLVPVADFLITGVLSLFWFAGSCAWASGLSSLKDVTKPEEVIRYNSATCEANQVTCKPGFKGNFATLNISVILGFLCFILWCSNLWFLYKETTWFKGQQAQQFPPGQEQQQQQPPQTYPPFPQQA